MTLEGQVEQAEQSEQFPQHEPEQIKPSNENELLHISIPVQIEAGQPEEFLQKNEQLALGIGTNLSDKAKRSGRIAIFLVLIGILFAGQFGVPDNEVKCVQDKVIEALGFANRFINTPGNERYRDFFQAFCSFLLDIIFLGTLGYWVLRGKSCRLPLSFGIFYGVRAIIQALWMSPFPEGNYWYSPGFPSLVVPYGRQSDFFFSGHSGFLVICACEWHKLKMPKLRNFVICTAIYTILILLIYRTHYIIDIFTGVIFAEWCFNKIDTYKDLVDKVWMQFLNFVKCLVGIRAVGINCTIYDEKGNPVSPKI